MSKKVLILTSAGVLGLLAGWFGGYLYYQSTKPSYGQFGAEFEGMDKAAIGAVIGLVVFTIAAYFIFIKKQNK